MIEVDKTVVNAPDEAEAALVAERAHKADEAIAIWLGERGMLSPSLDKWIAETSVQPWLESGALTVDNSSAAIAELIRGLWTFTPKADGENA